MSIFETLYRRGFLKKGTAAKKNAEIGWSSDTLQSPALFEAARFISTGGYVGYVPAAHGTAGSLWIPALYLALPGCWFDSFWGISIAITAAAAVLYVLGVWASGVCEERWGHDPGRVVIDEVVGMLIAVAFVPLTPVTVWTAFFLFRVFDIAKPWPIRRFERFQGGWGIMNDDVAAGIFANVVLRIVVMFL